MRLEETWRARYKRLIESGPTIPVIPLCASWQFKVQTRINYFGIVTNSRYSPAMFPGRLHKMSKPKPSRYIRCASSHRPIARGSCPLVPCSRPITPSHLCRGRRGRGRGRGRCPGRTPGTRTRAGRGRCPSPPGRSTRRSGHSPPSWTPPDTARWRPPHSTPPPGTCSTAWPL